MLSVSYTYTCSIGDNSMGPTGLGYLGEMLKVNRALEILRLVDIYENLISYPAFLQAKKLWV